jgi:ABC-type microcin C transport system duplicated ATPase subunit YejF
MRLVEPTGRQRAHRRRRPGGATTPCRLALRRCARALQIVFQDPQASLNPRMRAEDIVVEPLVIQGAPRGAAAAQAGAAELLEMVGLSLRAGAALLPA